MYFPGKLLKRNLMPEMSGDKVRPLNDVTLSRNKPDTCTVLLVLKIEQLITNEVQDFFVTVFTVLDKLLHFQ